MSSEILKIRHKDGAISRLPIDVSEDEPWWIEYVMSDGRVRRIGALSIFEALNVLRRECEKVGDRVLCAGARLDVYSSGMSRSMSGGRKAYVRRFGVHSDMRDLVDIFEDADPTQVGTVAEQEEAFDVWYRSVTSGQ